MNDYINNKHVTVNFSNNFDFENTLKELNLTNTLNEKKSVVLSILGNSDHYSNLFRLKNSFKRGLIKIIESIEKVVLITDGIFSGVGKLIGELIEEKYNNNKITVIDFSALETLYENNSVDEQPFCLSIVNENLSQTKAKFQISSNKNEQQPLLSERQLEMISSDKLDFNQSHVIIVKTEEKEKFKINQKLYNFRYQFEKYLFNIKEKSNFLSIVLNGDYYTLKIIKNLVEIEVPVMIIVGSKGSTDLIAKRINRNGQHYVNTYDPNEKIVSDILAKKSILTVFNIFNEQNSDDVSNQFKKAVFNALFSKLYSSNETEYLNLCLEWNQVDMAKNFFELKYSTPFLSELFKSALKITNTKFVQMILVLKIDIAKFLTHETLYSLYESQSTSKKLPLKWWFPNLQISIPKTDIYQIISKKIYELNIKYFNGSHLPYFPQDFDSNGSEPIFNDTNKYEKSVFNLFLWALLTKRFEIAEIFLKLSERPISLGLFASVLIKGLSIEHMPYSEDFTNEKAEKFEDLSIEILKYFDDNEPDEIVEHLLLTRLDIFENLHLLEFARKGKLKRFLSTEPVKRLINDIWLNGYPGYNSVRTRSFNEILLNCFMLGIFAPLNAFDHHEIDADIQSVLDNKSKLSFSKKSFVRINKKENFSYIDKLKFFHSIPAVRFFYDNVMFLLFMVLFSYYLLCEFDFYEYKLNKNLIYQNTPTDYILTVWVLCFFIEEMKELFFSNEKSLRINFQIYIKSNWNKLDLLGCIVYFAGFYIRMKSLWYHDDFWFEISRVTLCFDLIIWYFRILHFSLIVSHLGPKLVMIHKMLKDLIQFFPIFLTFLTAYGITVHAALYPRYIFNIDLFKNIIDLAYWPLFGEITFIDILNDQNKTELIETSNRFVTKSEIALFFGYIATIVYMIFGCILLLNIIIAVFTSTYTNVQARSNEILNFQQYIIVYEYDEKVNGHMPAPLNILVYLLYGLYYLYNQIKCWYCCKKAPAQPDNKSSISAFDKLERRYCKLYFRNKE